MTLWLTQPSTTMTLWLAETIHHHDTFTHTIHDYDTWLTQPSTGATVGDFWLSESQVHQPVQVIQLIWCHFLSKWEAGSSLQPVQERPAVSKQYTWRSVWTGSRAERRLWEKLCCQTLLLEGMVPLEQIFCKVEFQCCSNVNADLRNVLSFELLFSVKWNICVPREAVEEISAIISACQQT